MLSLTDVTSLLSHPDVKRVYSHYKSLQDNDYPSMNYIGLNFRAGAIVSLKLYFALYKRLEIHDVAPFLPVTDDFFKYYSLWDSSKERSLEHTGCTFEIKFKGTMTPTYGFHFRLRNCEESYDLIGRSSSLPFDDLDLGTRPGINYEYDESGPLRKRYYYAESAEHKEFLSKKFNIPFILKSSLSELSEFNNITKLNVCRFDYSEENMLRENHFNSDEREVIQFFRRKYGLINVFDGFYDDKETKATYFFNTKDKTENSFNQSKNFHIDTMKLFGRD